MALTQRQSEILDLIREQGFATIDDLARQFDVTPQTVRRDINRMCVRQILQRHHGGASLVPSAENAVDKPRHTIRRVDKWRIGEMVARHIPNDASLFINIGTTAEEVARGLIHHRRLKVITNNLIVANTLSGNKDAEVIIAGGVVYSRNGGIAVSTTADFFIQFKVDFGIIGVDAIDADGSLLGFDYREVEVIKAIISNSREVFLATKVSKFNQNAMVRFGNIGQLSAVFTDRAPPEEIRQMLSDADVMLHVATDA